MTVQTPLVIVNGQVQRLQSGDSISGAVATVTQVEVNLGAAPRLNGQFVIADAGIGPTSRVVVQQAGGPYTGKGTLADEAEMDGVTCAATPGTGQATVHWSSPRPVMGNFKFNYVVG